MPRRSITFPDDVYEALRIEYAGRIEEDPKAKLTFNDVVIDLLRDVLMGPKPGHAFTYIEDFSAGLLSAAVAGLAMTHFKKAKEERGEGEESD